jgi:hypothetical protein
MKQLIEKLIATNFADLEGLQISGSVPVKQELMNEVLQEFLKGAGDTKEAAPASPVAESSDAATLAPIPEPSAPKKSGPRLNPKDLIKLITHAEVQAHEGELRLNFEIRR